MNLNEPNGGFCRTGDRCDLSSANGSRLCSGGPRGSHVAGRLNKHLEARQPWGPHHGSLIDGRIWTTGSTRLPKYEGDEVEKRDSLRK